MICPVCANTGQRSQVRMVRTWKLTPDAKVDNYYDENGEHHSHDPRVVMTEYTCTNGHSFAERSSWQCCVCGYRACDAELVAAPNPEPAPVPAGPPVRTSSGRVITSAERAALNAKKGGR